MLVAGFSEKALCVEKFRLVALFRSLLEWGLVDTVEPAIIPVLVGGGVPFLPSPAVQKRLQLTGHRIFPSGIVWLEYTVLSQ